MGITVKHCQNNIHKITKIYNTFTYAKLTPNGKTLITLCIHKDEIRIFKIYTDLNNNPIRQTLLKECSNNSENLQDSIDFLARYIGGYSELNVSRL